MKESTTSVFIQTNSLCLYCLEDLFILLKLSLLKSIPKYQNTGMWLTIGEDRQTTAVSVLRRRTTFPSHAMINTRADVDQIGYRWCLNREWSIFVYTICSNRLTFRNLKRSKPLRFEYTNGGETCPQISSSDSE